MRIGIVSIWGNRGQATVARHLRSVLERLGHSTFVLARPMRGNPPPDPVIMTSDVWDQPGVTHGSQYFVPRKEYLDWARACELDAVFCDQNYQFEELSMLRAMGIRTFGRFVWEKFQEKHVEDARRAFDVIYSLTECEARRYEELGIESHFIRWGCHPEIRPASPRARDGRIRYFFPATGRRKPQAVTVDAFRESTAPGIELVIKGHETRHIGQIDRIAAPDPRITVIHDELDFAAYHRLFASCDVCLAPSRWEGLGLHLFEAFSHGLPIITNDAPPMNELVEHGVNGFLVRSHVDGQTRSGVPRHEPDRDDLVRAIEHLADPARVERLSAGVTETREGKLAWDRTVEGFERLIEE